MFLGDYALIPEESKNATLKKLYLHTVQNGDPSIGHDAVYEQYRNVSCLFHEAEPIVREEIDFYIKDIEQSVFDYFNQYSSFACSETGTPPIRLQVCEEKLQALIAETKEKLQKQ